MCGHYRERCDVIQLGTGDSPKILEFYKRCGFEIVHRIPNFFVDNYDTEIIDRGVRLVDMVYLRRRL